MDIRLSETASFRRVMMTITGDSLKRETNLSLTQQGYSRTNTNADRGGQAQHRHPKENAALFTPLTNSPFTYYTRGETL
jgi:hypothetical protein